jgi:hypothetical protein
MVEKPKDPKADPKSDKAVAKDPNQLADLPKTEQELTQEQAKDIKGGSGPRFPMV